MTTNKEPFSFEGIEPILSSLKNASALEGSLTEARAIAKIIAPFNDLTAQIAQWKTTQEVCESIRLAASLSPVRSFGFLNTPHT